jgi:tRNA A37 methylthiotransferase MiaB
MNRHYDIARVRSFVRELKAASPEVLVWTHMIAGFPGETEEDFEASMQAVDGFDYFYAYPFFRNPGTPSADFEDQVPMAEARRRARLLKRKLYRMLTGRLFRDLFSWSRN